MKKTTIAALFLALVSSASVSTASADGYPSRTISIVNPFAVGGITDTTARYYAEKLSRRLGQSVVVEAKSGAGGMIATNYVIRSKADGYTLLFGSRVTQITSPLINRQPVPTEKDLIPVASVSEAAAIIVTAPGKSWKSLEELVAYAKANPDKVNYGSPGAGSAAHVAAEELARLAGIKMVHVPFRGSTGALQAVMAGDVDVAFDYPSSSMAQIESGRLVPLATMYQKRFSALPNVPTVAEAGVPGAEAGSWLAFFVPGGTPPDVVARLAKEITEINAEPDTQEKLISWGTIPFSKSGQEFNSFIEQELTRWTRTIDELKLATP